MRSITTQIRLTNQAAVWDTYHLYLALFIVALIIDTVSTIDFMCIDGPGAEIHPIVRGAAILWGPVAGPILAGLYKLCAAGVIMYYCKKLAKPVLSIATVTYLFAGFYNYFATDLYELGVVSWLPF